MPYRSSFKTWISVFITKLAIEQKYSLEQKVKGLLCIRIVHCQFAKSNWPIWRRPKSELLCNNFIFILYQFNQMPFCKLISYQIPCVYCNFGITSDYFIFPVITKANNVRFSSMDTKYNFGFIKLKQQN